MQIIELPQIGATTHSVNQIVEQHQIPETLKGETITFSGKNVSNLTSGFLRDLIEMVASRDVDTVIFLDISRWVEQQIRNILSENTIYTNMKVLINP